MKKTALLFLCLAFATLLSAQPSRFTVGFNNICSIHAEHNLKQTFDGGYIFCSMRPLALDTGNPAIVRGYLIKMDSTGDVEWARMFPTASFTIKVGSSASVVQTADSGYVVATTYFFRYTPTSSLRQCTYLIKTDQNGNLQWSRLYTGRGDSRPFCIQETADHGLIVSGMTSDTAAPASHEGFLLRTDSAGNVLWSKSYGDPGGQVDLHAVVELGSGDFIATGRRLSTGVVLKTNANGSLIWTRGTITNVIFFDVVEIPGNELMVAGADYFNGGTAVYRLDTAGTHLWAGVYGMSGAFQGTSIVRDTTGYTLAGTNFNADAQGLLHIDFNGNPVWSRLYPELDVDIYPALVACSDGGYIFPGVHENSSLIYDWSFVITKTDSLGRAWCDSTVTVANSLLGGMPPTVLSTTSVGDTVYINTVLHPVMFPEFHPCPPETVGMSEAKPTEGISVYPNPTNDFLIVQSSFASYEGVRVRLCDVTGRTVFEDALRSSQQEINLSSMSAGLYFLLLEENGVVIAKKPVMHN